MDDHLKLAEENLTFGHCRVASLYMDTAILVLKALCAKKLADTQKLGRAFLLRAEVSFKVATATSPLFLLIEQVGTVNV